MGACRRWRDWAACVGSHVCNKITITAHHPATAPRLMASLQPRAASANAHLHRMRLFFANPQRNPSLLFGAPPLCDRRHELTATRSDRADTQHVAGAGGGAASACAPGTPQAPEVQVALVFWSPCPPRLLPHKLLHKLLKQFLKTSTAQSPGVASGRGGRPQQSLLLLHRLLARSPRRRGTVCAHAPEESETHTRHATRRRRDERQGRERRGESGCSSLDHWRASAGVHRAAAARGSRRGPPARVESAQLVPARPDSDRPMSYSIASRH